MPATNNKIKMVIAKLSVSFLLFYTVPVKYEDSKGSVKSCINLPTEQKDIVIKHFTVYFINASI